MERIYSGAATRYIDAYGCAGYTATVAGVNSLEVRLPCICRGKYVYDGFRISNSVFSNGDTLQIGEYADGAVLWSTTITRSGGVWVGAAAGVLPNLERLVVNGNSVTITGMSEVSVPGTYSITKTKPYGKFFLKATTNGICDVYIAAYGVATTLTSQELIDGYFFGAPTEYAYVQIENDRPEWGNEYFSQKLQCVFPAQLSYGDFSKAEWTNSGKYRVTESANAKKTYAINTVMTEIEVARWRYFMNIDKWNSLTYFSHNDLVNIGTYDGSKAIIESIEFGDEIEFGVGLYDVKFRISEIVGRIYDAGVPNIGKYPARFSLSSQSQSIRSTTTHRMDSKPDQLTCTVMCRNVLWGDANSIVNALEFPVGSTFTYTPNQGIYPFGPDKGDGPFTVRFINYTATTNTPYHWDIDITLAYESKL
jgi:hypothetical protein